MFNLAHAGSCLARECWATFSSSWHHPVAGRGTSTRIPQHLPQGAKSQEVSKQWTETLCSPECESYLASRLHTAANKKVNVT